MVIRPNKSHVHSSLFFAIILSSLLFCLLYYLAPFSLEPLIGRRRKGRKDRDGVIIQTSAINCICYMDFMDIPFFGWPNIGPRISGRCADKPICRTRSFKGLRPAYPTKQSAPTNRSAQFHGKSFAYFY